MLTKLRNRFRAWRSARTSAALRQRRAFARVEFLEARCMLSFAPLAGDFFAPADVMDSGPSTLIGDERQLELELPPAEIPPTKDDNDGGLVPVLPTQPWEKEENGSQPADDIDPADGAEPADPGGLIEDLDQPTDAKPFEEPSPRVVRSVFAMLAALKYSVAADDESLFDELARKAHDGQLRELDSPDAEGGAIEIAVSEIAAEQEFAEPANRDVDDESLLEVAVEMDRSAGRFQAFEVLTTEDVPAATATEFEMPARTQAQPATFDFGDAPQAAPPANQPRGNEVGQSAALDPVGDAISAASSAPTAAVADEKSSSIWSLGFGLVTFGFVLQLLRSRNSERAKAQAELEQGLCTNLIQ